MSCFKLTKLLLVLITLLSPAVSEAAEFSFLNRKPLYKEPFAYVRSPDLGIALDTSTYEGHRVGYFEVSIGKNLPILTIDFDVLGDTLSFQTGAELGFWATLGYIEGDFPLLTQDFLVAIPLEFKYKNLSGAIKFNHISSHLGDGFDKVIKHFLDKKTLNDLESGEEIIREFGEDDSLGISLRQPVTYSREFFSFHIAYDSKILWFDHRSYAHIGYAYHIIPKYLGRWYLGSGFELSYPWHVSPYYSQDLTWHEDKGTVDWSGELGIIILPEKTSIFAMRVAVTAYVGGDRRGQFLDRTQKQIGVGIFIN